MHKNHLKLYSNLLTKINQLFVLYVIITKDNERLMVVNVNKDVSDNKLKKIMLIIIAIIMIF